MKRVGFSVTRPACETGIKAATELEAIVGGQVWKFAARRPI